MTTSLKQQLTTDLTASMKARDKVRSTTVRAVLSAISTAEVAGSDGHALTDDEVLAVIGKEAKKRRDSIDAFSGAGREDLAEGERAELAILEAYLPAQLSDQDLAELVDQAVAESGANSPADMGRAMAVAREKVAGRAEGGRVAAIVKQRLAQ